MKRRTFFLSSATALAASQLLPNSALASAFASGAGQPPALEKVSGAVAADDTRFWNMVRAQFPLTTDRIYLNTGGLGASPYAVIDAVKAKMDELEKVSETGHSEGLWKQIKTDAAALFHCDADEIAFTRNTTEGVNIIANGIALKKGDEVILTTQEHVGNAITWVEMQKKDGIVIRRFEPSTASAQENLDRLKKLITSRTRIIAIPHIVTTTGLIMPVKEIADLARSKNIFFLIDGAQSGGMIPIDLHAVGCDAYATSGHKWLMGPKETGLLYVRKAMLDTVRAKFIGAYSDNGFDFDKGELTLHPSAQRYEYGTISVPLRVGLGAAFKFIDAIGMNNIWEHDRAMSSALFEGLKKEGSITVLSPADPSMRSAMITISHKTLSYTKLQEELNKFKLRTRVVTEGGLAALRLSLHCYNSFDDVETILKAVHAAG
ncbi:MAG: aminotransferase class V-fold PLP-dependent enzyme [Acidobacteriota bacterium]